MVADSLIVFNFLTIITACIIVVHFTLCHEKSEHIKNVTLINCKLRFYFVEFRSTKFVQIRIMLSLNLYFTFFSLFCEAPNNEFFKTLKKCPKILSQTHKKKTKKQSTIQKKQWQTTPLSNLDNRKISTCLERSRSEDNKVIINW